MLIGAGRLSVAILCYSPNLADKTLQELTTCDPSFYKHTQRLFLMLFERGLAYQAEAEVNYDPVDKTVLANEQVDANGCSWRSGAKVEKKMLKQWFFKISAYRDALLEDLDNLSKDELWPDHVISQQRNWLGKSTGAMIKFPIMAMNQVLGNSIKVYTTRPDTLFGAQYIALAATHPMVVNLAKVEPELQAFLDTLPGLPPDSKVGYLLPNIKAINPLAYHEDTPGPTKMSLPIYVAPYVLGDYGEGAVMGVPGHDVRDNSFWRQHQDRPVRFVLAKSEVGTTAVVENEESTAFTEMGYMTDESGPFAGMKSADAGRMMMEMLDTAKLAEKTEKWRLRDWLISRQRYWGTPIPIVHCSNCGAVPVPESELPVELPQLDQHWTEGKVGNPLDSASDFVNTSCPKCQQPARRDTDTMDTFVDSSWYFARYADPSNEKQLFSLEASRSLPVDTYLGGTEHAILHLLYARFIYKFLTSTPLFDRNVGSETSRVEPFTRMITQGMVHGKTYIDPDSGKFLKEHEVDLTKPTVPMVIATGKTAVVSFEKMSKSKHNGVDPTNFISLHGADATRAHMLFQAPVADVLNWDDQKIAGVVRWLHRLHDQIAAISDLPKTNKSVAEYLQVNYEKLANMSQAQLAVWDADVTLWREVQQTITSIGKSYDEVYTLNTVISDLMSLTNTLSVQTQATALVRQGAADAIVRLMAPITPAFAEECWSLLEPSRGSIFETAGFPNPDSTEAFVQPRSQQCAVQINGKVRGVVRIPLPPANMEGDVLRSWMTEQVLKTEEGKARFGKGPYDLTRAKRAIPVKGGKVINFVL